jgi:hypothetical protein
MVTSFDNHLAKILVILLNIQKCYDYILRIK